MILQLVQDPRHLEYFLEHDTMLTALTRILNEERRKSVDLVKFSASCLIDSTFTHQKTRSRFLCLSSSGDQLAGDLFLLQQL